MDQLEKIITVARKSIVDNLDKSYAAEGNKEYEKLANAVHSLKGTLLQCGLFGWAEKAQKIHTSAKNGEMGSFLEKLDELRDALIIWAQKDDG